MGEASYAQTNFLGGEWSPFFQGRFDRPDYRSAMSLCQNAFPLEEGCCVRRPGFRFAATTRNGVAGRVMQWTFNEASPYQLEFTPGHMRVFSGASGANDLVYDSSAVVSSISTATPAVVNTSTTTSWSSGDHIKFQVTTGASCASSVLAPLQNREFVITVIDSSHFSLSDPITGASINGATCGWVANAPITAIHIFDMATPYTGTLWQSLRLVQANTYGVLLEGSVAPQVVQEITTTTNPTFSIGALNFVDGPYLDQFPLTTNSPSQTSQATPSGTSGTVTLTVQTTPWWGGFVAGDVGRLIRINSQPPEWSSTTAYSISEAVSFNNLPYQALGNSTGAEPDISPTNWSPSPTSGQWFYGPILTVISATQVTIAFNFGPLYAIASDWQLGVYGGANGYPTCGCFAYGRLWLGGAVPNRFDASQSGSFSDQLGPVFFGPTDTPGTPLIGQVIDSNSISYTLNSDSANPILWMRPTDTGIIMGTQSGEWLVAPAVNTSGISPTNINALPATKFGSTTAQPAEPQGTPLTLLFVQRYGIKIQEYFSDVFSGRKTGSNIAERARHLTQPGCVEIAFQRELTPILWSRYTDGSFAGVTYKRESLMSSQGPTFMGWHRHYLGSGQSVESICSGPSVTGTTDSVAICAVANTPAVWEISTPYAVGQIVSYNSVNYTCLIGNTGQLPTNATYWAVNSTYSATGLYHVEFLTDIFAQDELITSAQFLDDSTPPSNHGFRGAQLLTSNGAGQITFFGLWHLNGNLCTAWIGGVDCGDYIVENGQMTVPLQTGPNALFTTTMLQTLTAAYTANTSIYDSLLTTVDDVNGNVLYQIPAVIGFTYTTQGQIVRPVMPQESGARDGPALGKTRRHERGAWLLQDTQGISFGTDFASTLHAAKLCSYPGGTITLPLNQLFSGIYWDTLDGTSNFEGNMSWQVTRPYPATVVACEGFLATTDQS